MKSRSLRARMGIAAVVVLAIAAACTQVSAQAVYVSTGAGQQILAFDANSGAVTGVCSIAAVPEDVVVGPDGNLYVADTNGNRIFRVDPANLKNPAGQDCGAVAIYDQAVCGVNCPAGPEGSSFLRIRTLDLYFNTHGAGGTGVWKIPGIANAGNTTCSGASCPAPVQVLSAATSGEGSGEGLEFDVFGKMLAVDQTNGKVIRESVGCFNDTHMNCFSNFNFISGLTAPVGIAQNPCGDILVTSGNSINRYSGISGGNSPLDSRTFSGGNNVPRFLEVDSSGRLFVITAGDESGKNATFWRFDPPANTPPTAAAAPQACVLGSYTQRLSVAISKNLALGIVGSNGLGLGISASNAQITQSFSAPTAKNPTANIQTYNFGAQHSLTVTCNNVMNPFNLTITAVKSKPSDTDKPEVTFSPPQFAGAADPIPGNPQCPVAVVDAQCMHYGGQHGFCTQYLEEALDPKSAPANQPITDENLSGFCSATSTQNPFTFLVNFDSAEFVHDPGGAHATVDVVTNPPTSGNITQAYSDCQSQDFYPQLSTGDPVRLTGSNSKHVVFNSDEVFNGAITLNSPVSSCQLPTNCNPQFNIGQNINVKFTLLQSTAPFSAITNATEQLSIARVRHVTKGVDSGPEFVPQTVVATKNSATLNFFVPNSSGQYSYNADSSAFDKLPKGTNATYQFTIWGNGADPFTFFTTGTF